MLPDHVSTQAAYTHLIVVIPPLYCSLVLHFSTCCSGRAIGTTTCSADASTITYITDLQGERWPRERGTGEILWVKGEGARDGAGCHAGRVFPGGRRCP